MERLSIPDYSDFWWDTARSGTRQKKILAEQLIPCMLFAKAKVPFYREYYRHLSNRDIQGISDLPEFVATIPHVTKTHLAANHPLAFVPEGEPPETDPHHGPFFRFGTGGTTGKPILIIHGMTDWRGMAITANRLMEFDFYRDEAYADRFDFDRGAFNFNGMRVRKTPLLGRRIMGAYNADHITNTIYGTMFHRLGSEFFWRPSAQPDADDIVDTMAQFRIHGILAPPEGENIKKGSFLRHILEADTCRGGAWRLNHRYNEGFQFVFWSSMPIPGELMAHLEADRKIPYIKGHFGSTEICPTAATCSRHPRKFHLCFGHSLLLTKKRDRDEMADPDELGYTLVSKTGATDRDGRNVLPSGMIFINYMTGDGARLTRDGDPCDCGRNTPVIYDLQRLDFHKGKARHGCQIA